MSENAAYLCALSAVLLALGCGDDDDGARTGRRRDAGEAADASAMQPGAAPLTPPALPPPFACDDPRLTLLRVEPWPGGGLQLALALQNDAGAERAPSAESVRLLRADGQAASVRVRVHPQAAGLSALLFVPSADAAQHAQRIAAARALIAALPAAERIALFLLAPGLPLAAELSERHAHVLARLDALRPAPADAPLAPALALVASRLREVASPWGPIARNLVVIGAPLAGPAPPVHDEDAGPLATSGGDGSPRWLLRDGLLQASLAAGDDPAASTIEAAAEAARSLALHGAEQRASMALLGACGPFAAGEALVLEWGGARCELIAPAPSVEWAGAACDPGAAADDAYPFADQIELDLSAEQLALHDQYAQSKSEAEFALQLRVGASAPVAARAHYRGQTSLDCERKSYSVELADGSKRARARRLAPGFVADEFYLLSMCHERHYFRQVAASKMLRALGLFPLDQRYVRLRVAGRERGVYLLIEKPEHTLRADQLALAGLVRRRLEADNLPSQAKFPNDPAGAARALDEYEALAARIDRVAPAELTADLSARFDLDGYLDWHAFNAYLQSGDSSDEAFFYASNERGADGDGWYFRHHGWDADDLFLECHHQGRFALTDASGLLYCAESKLDRALVVSPELDARFVDRLAQLIGVTLPPDRVARLLAETRAELFVQLQDDAVCGALSELVLEAPDAARCERTRALIDEAIAGFERQLRARAGELQGAIDAQRGQP